MSIRDRYLFVSSPVATKNLIAMDMMLKFATRYSKGVPCKLESLIMLPDRAPQNPEELKDLEVKHKVIMLYMWLR
ncbi:hypothetical protein BC936DRAFT_139084 [Jimgerdemannia flammicorona]|uniref:Uncharacterized protein n=2 Tax=Jimgerdemannia flammicorona TaxID=994334 RepID=A0A433QDU9_9FUNG|nr:hypothetical protein BC936DRAFT_139084 [Jimgerdemannia flammicorona]RUS27909.1 hypothetical protein BC938DRAFT_482579 [Jimgerdemannia flammicorona]